MYKKQIELTRKIAWHTVRQCDICPQYLFVSHLEVDPQGLIPRHLWLMAVTHIAELGKLRCVHVTTNAYSGFLMASAQTGEVTKHMMTYCLK